MAKKRKLADLVKEETQRVEKEVETEQLNNNFVTDSESLQEHRYQTTKVKDSVTTKLTESRTLEPNNSQATELRTTKLTESQSLEPNNSQATELRTAKLTESQSLEPNNSQANKVTDFQTSSLPRYQMLARKETRLREEQLDKLTTLSRQLNRQRRGKGERITENTLIRLAVDLLLLREGELIGTTETELQKALGLKVTE